MLQLSISSSLRVMLVLIALSILISSVFWYGAKPTESLVKTNTLASSPDYFITNASVSVFDNEGRLTQTTEAAQALHYINQSKTLLDKPVTIRQSESSSWSATAEKGIIEDGSHDILLTGNASATQRHLTNNSVSLIAKSIHYLEDNQSLISNGEAALFSTQGRTSADTITTFINSEEVTMTGSVRGKYETAH